MKLNTWKFFLLVLSLTACGQTGPLYLSTETSPITVPDNKEPPEEKKQESSPSLIKED